MRRARIAALLAALLPALLLAWGGSAAAVAPASAAQRPSLQSTVPATDAAAGEGEGKGVASAVPAVPIPYKRGSAVPDSAVTGGAVGVLLLSLLAIAAVYLLRKRLKVGQPRGDGRHLRVLETQRLGPRALLSVVEFAGIRYLVAQSEHGVSCLASAPGAPEPAP